MENVRPGEVDRHVSYDAGRDHDDQKNIELSVAEVQVSLDGIWRRLNVIILR